MVGLSRAALAGNNQQYINRTGTPPDGTASTSHELERMTPQSQNPPQDRLGQPRQNAAARDPESLTLAPVRPPRMHATQFSLNCGYANTTLKKRLKEAYRTIRDQAKMMAPSVEAGIKDTKEIQAGDYCVKFRNRAYKWASINFAAEAASIATTIPCTIGSIILAVDYLVPNAQSPMGSTGASQPSGQPHIPAQASASAVTFGDSLKATGITGAISIMAYPAQQMFKNLYLSTIKGYLESKHDHISAMEENFKKFLSEEYEPHKNDMSPHIRVVSEKCIKKIQDLYNTMRPEKDAPTNMTLAGIEDTIAFIATAQYWLDEFLVHKQDGLKEMEGWKTEAGREKILKTTIEHSGFYKDPMVRDQVRNLIMSHGCRSIDLDKYDVPPEMMSREVKQSGELGDKDGIKEWFHWDEVPEIPQKEIFVIGLPGVGKGYLDKLWDKLKVPHFSQTYQSLMKGGVSAGDPAKWRALNQRKYLTREGDLLGERLFKMLAAGCRNAIRNVDEPNFDDKDGAKRDLDPYMQNFETECLEAMYRVMDGCTVVKANDVPKAKARKVEDIFHEIDPAFSSRADYILIGEPDRETIETQAKRAFRALASRYCLGFRSGDAPILDKDKQERLLESFKHILPTLADLHLEKKGDLRMFTVVEPVFKQIVGTLLSENIKGQPLLDKEDMKKWVEKYYAPMRVNNPYSNSFNSEQQEKDTPAKPDPALLRISQVLQKVMGKIPQDELESTVERLFSPS